MLADARHYERAEFLTATATEEMGKAYILVDMCRVDFKKRSETVRYLCRAFYDHVRKHVYFDLCANRYPGIWELEQVRDAFLVGVREWWPGSLEDGEPDMPHETYFLREANLYVDFDEFSGSWSIPSYPAKSVFFESPFSSPLDDAVAALKGLQFTQNLGLFHAEALATLNRRMKRVRVTESMATEDLAMIYAEVALDLQGRLGVAPSDFEKSQLRTWPLYWITA